MMESVSFKVNGITFPVKEAWIVYDVTSYYCIVEVISERNLPISMKVVLESRETTELVLINSVFSGSLYTHTFVSKLQWDMLNLTTSPIKGVYSLKSLFKTLGVNAYIESDTVSAYWSIPELNYVSFLKHLNKYCPGVSPRFYLDLVGNIRCVDFGKSSNKEPIDLGGVVKSDVTNLDWITLVPQSVVFYSSSVNGFKKEEISHTNTQTRSKIFVNDTTGHLLDLTKRAYLNDYNYYLYTTRQIQLEEVTTSMVALGDKVFVNKAHYGIVSYIRFPIYTITNYQLSVQVVCPA